MKTLSIITCTEYRANQPSIFTIVNGNYVGCLIYPSSRNYPELTYWNSAESSDSGRGFSSLEKSFSDDEIEKIELLQSVINSLNKLIPNQPHWEFISSSGFKIKRGKAYQDYKAKVQAQSLAVKAYFDSIKVYDQARTQAFDELRNILTK